MFFILLQFSMLSMSLRGTVLPAREIGIAGSAPLVQVSRWRLMRGEADGRYNQAALLQLKPHETSDTDAITARLGMTEGRSSKPARERVRGGEEVAPSAGTSG